MRQRLARICSWSVIAGAKRDDRRVALVGPEELALVEAERLRDQHGREALLDRVVAVDGLVVVAAGGGELVLDVGELLLEREEVLRRPQLRIGLGDGDQPVQRAAELLVRLRRRGRARRLLGCRTGLRHLLEGLALVRGVALHRLDQVRDEVVPPPELDVDVRPARLGLVPQPDEAVVRVDEEEEEQDDHRGDDDRDPHAGRY